MQAQKAKYPVIQAREQLIVVHSCLKEYKKAASYLKKLQKDGACSREFVYRNRSGFPVPSKMMRFII